MTGHEAGEVASQAYQSIARTSLELSDLVVKINPDGASGERLERLNCQLHAARAMTCLSMALREIAKLEEEALIIVYPARKEDKTS